MKEKLLILTKKLIFAGFNIERIDVIGTNIVRITFQNANDLAILVNDVYAKIEKGACDKKTIEKLESIISTDYNLKDSLETIENDIFSKLLNA